jgi:outer membrane protein TolC
MKPHYFAALLLFPTLAFSAAPKLTMEAYLAEVGSKNREVKAAQESSEGAALRASEANLIYSPIFSAEAQWLNDHKTNSLFPGAYEKFRSDNYTLGLAQQTNFGLQAKLSYTLTNYDYVGNRPRFWEGQPKIEVSQSLLRNGFGSETRAQAEMVEASALATQYQQSFQAKAVRAEAEGAYVRLASARELRAINEDSLKRAEEILGWNNRRARLNLGEDSDLYQAQANIELVKLQLQSAIDAERTAARDFNRLRGVDSDEVADVVSLPESISALAPSRAQFRDDVQAAIANTRVAAASATLGKEKNKPTLEVYGLYALNARENERSRAISRSFDEEAMGPTSAVGVRFQTPILVGMQADVVKGYAKEKSAAESLKDQRLFDQEVQWKELTLRFDEAKKRYAIAQKLVEIQRKKAATERARLRRGRTTTYQTLLFDQELNQAEAGRIQAVGEILQLTAQMKTYQ